MSAGAFHQSAAPLLTVPVLLLLVFLLWAIIVEPVSDMSLTAPYSVHRATYALLLGLTVAASVVAPLASPADPTAPGGLDGAAAASPAGEGAEEGAEAADASSADGTEGGPDAAPAGVLSRAPSLGRLSAVLLAWAIPAVLAAAPKLGRVSLSVALGGPASKRGAALTGTLATVTALASAGAVFGAGFGRSLDALGGSVGAAGAAALVWPTSAAVAMCLLGVWGVCLAFGAPPPLPVAASKAKTANAAAKTDAKGPSATARRGLGTQLLACAVSIGVLVATRATAQSGDALWRTIWWASASASALATSGAMLYGNASGVLATASASSTFPLVCAVAVPVLGAAVASDASGLSALIYPALASLAAPVNALAAAVSAAGSALVEKLVRPALAFLARVGSKAAGVIQSVSVRVAGVVSFLARMKPAFLTRGGAAAGDLPGEADDADVLGGAADADGALGGFEDAGVVGDA